MDFDIGTVRVKELGRLSRQVKETVGGISGRKTTKHDLNSELSIDLDGISELTRIDPKKFIALVKGVNPNFNEVFKEYRHQVFNLTKYSLTNEMVDSIVEKMITLDMLKELVYEAGGYEKALEHVCEKYNVAHSNLDIAVNPDELLVTTLENPKDINQAHRIIKYSYGPNTTLNLSSLFVLSIVGKLMGVKDKYGRLIGVVQLLYDKWGDSFIHSYGVLKRYRGSGIELMLLDIVEKNARGRFIWTARSTKFNYNIRNLLDKGYSGRYVLTTTYVEDNPLIIFEHEINKTQSVPPKRPNNIPQLDELTGGIDAFKASVSNLGLLKQALNTGNFEMVDYEVQESNSYNAILIKAKTAGHYGQRIYDVELPHVDAGYTFHRLESKDDMSEIIKLANQSNITLEKNLTTLRIIIFAGLMIGIKNDAGELLASTGLLWSNDGSLFCHALVSSPKHPQDIKFKLLSFIIKFAERTGQHVVNLLHPMDDINFIKTAINTYGFKAVREYLDTNYNKVNYLQLRCGAKSTDSMVEYDVNNAVKISSIPGLNPSLNCILISVKNYALIKSVLNDGYSIVKVLDTKETTDAKVDKPMFLLVR